MKFRHLLTSFLMITMTPHAFSCKFLEEEHEASEVRKTTLTPHSSIDGLHDEIMLMIFSFLNQKDIPSIIKTSKRWQRLMDNNQLWEGYAKRAFIIMHNEEYSQDRNYKALVKDHCTPSFTDLGTLKGGTNSQVVCVNFDGSVIIGDADDGTVRGYRAFRWTPATGMESLGTLNGGTAGSLCVSFDGSVIVGDADERAFRCTAETSMKSLGTLNRGTYSRAWDVNFDGSVIVGDADDGAAQGQKRAFRWTLEEGMESVEKLLTDRGLFPPDWILTRVNAITPNGVVLVGQGQYEVQMENGDEITLVPCLWRAVIPRGNLF